MSDGNVKFGRVFHAKALLTFFELHIPEKNSIQKFPKRCLFYGPLVFSEVLIFA
jgi:hypothetical protein